MKELSIEEKAKRYDEAILQLKGLLDGIHEEKCDIMEEDIIKIFPELKESEDERIRKWIEIELESKYVVDNIVNNEMADKALAWLEKQKDMEAKLIISDEGYNKAFQDGIEEVLTNPHKYGLEKQGEQKPMDKVEPKFKVGDKIISTISNIPYYITEVRNGYYLTDVGCVIMFNAQNNFELSNQSHAWSEEDVKMIGTLVAIFEVNYPDGFYKVNHIGTTNMQGIHSSEIIKWLKSLKDRVQPQPKNEWSEEDVRNIQDIDSVLFYDKSLSEDTCMRLRNWLESLKDRLATNNKAQKGEEI